MPTTRMRRSRGRILAGGITEADYLYYTFGQFFEAEGYADGKTEAELKAFWRTHRKAIMDRYLEEIRRRGKHEGCRPWPFWKWDVIEPRLAVDMTLAPNELYDYKKVGPDGLEGDFAYLKRLGLLEDWEK